MSGKKNKKKKKDVYIDDGRTIADMSMLRGGYNRPVKKGGFKEQLHTYLDACKMMLIPMLVTIGIISIAFLIIYFML